MKRSEMVEIIMNELAGQLNYQTMPIIVASELLAKLEENGMKPPRRCIGTPEGGIRGKLYYENTWEKESTDD